MLTGQRILVTRPRAQATALVEAIEVHEGTAILFPVLETKALARPRYLDALASYQALIFISVNAVQFTWDNLNAKAQQQLQQLPCIAVGKRTAQALKEKQVKHIFVPPAPFNSETLLASERLQQVAQQRLLLCKGQGGRQLLEQSLAERGARVDLCEVYQRVRPAFSPEPWMASGAIEQVIVTSAEGLYNLEQMLEQPAWLYQRPWVLISQRLAGLAKAAGVSAPIKVAKEASDNALLEALLNDS